MEENIGLIIIDYFIIWTNSDNGLLLTNIDNFILF